MKISDFTLKELEFLLDECNFTEEEEEFFNLRAKDKSLTAISQVMHISSSKANTLSRKVRKKINKAQSGE